MSTTMTDKGKLQLISEDCARCGHIIEVASPTWYRLDWSSDGNAKWSHKPDATALCLACSTSQACPQEHRGSDIQRHQLVARKRASEVPEGATLFHLRTQNEHVYAGVHGVYQFDLYFVHARGPVPEGWTLPRAWFQGQEHETPLLLFVGFDVSLSGVPASASYIWTFGHPSREGVFYIKGWSLATHNDIMRLMEAARAFHQRRSGGRPRGSTDHTYEDYQQAFARVANILGHPPRTLDEFLGCAGLSRDTFKRNLKRWGTTWTAFRREQLSG